MKKIRIALLGMSLRSRNLGVQALTFSFLEFMAEVSAGSFEPVFYMVNFEEGFEEEHITIREHAYTVKYVFPTILSTPKDIARSIVKDLRPGHLLDFFRKLSVDIVFCIGAGDSFSDIYGTFRYKIVNEPIRFFHSIGKPYVFLPQTIGPFDDPKIRASAKKTLENACSIMVRDQQSCDVAHELAPSKRIESFIDLAFFLGYNQHVFSHEKINVGINVSGLLWNSPQESFSIESDYRKTIKQVMDFFVGMQDVNVFLVAHVPGKQKTQDNDFFVAQEIAAGYQDKAVSVAPYFETATEAKNFISGLDFFAGARMHACIAAFSSGVPVVPMSYSRKFNGLFLDTLNYDRKHFADLRGDSTEDILKTVKDSFFDRDAIKAEIAKTNDGVVKDNRTAILSTLTLLLHDTLHLETGHGQTQHRC